MGFSGNLISSLRVDENIIICGGIADGDIHRVPCLIHKDVNTSLQIHAPLTAMFRASMLMASARELRVTPSIPSALRTLFFTRRRST